MAVGEAHVICCAVTKDGTTSPASEALDKLAEGEWENHNSPSLPDDCQIDLHDQFFAICEYFADNGEPPTLYDINQLGFGMWEFRAGWLRAAFYDTDGAGNYEAKNTRFGLHNQDWDEIPYFSPQIRLTLCMSKKHMKAVPKELAYARQVRTEDLHHDKEAS
ncbi:hypothetical protein ACX80L_14105 [Arthrobacter sp. MDT1-48-3]